MIAMFDIFTLLYKEAKELVINEDPENKIPEN